MRLLVDGMNVIGSRPTGWWRDRPRAMRELVERLQRLDDEVSVVFDGRPLDDLAAGRHGAVTVLYAAHADDRIAELAEPGTTVVTSDRILRARTEQAGAAVAGASWLLERLEARGSG